jgi:RNA polymerase sigma factor (TIGR02999 family)
MQGCREMPIPMPQDLTRLLVDWSKGDQAALDQLMPLVYDELRHLANAYLRRERPDHTLQTTALVHEAYLRLVDQRAVSLQGRAQFFSLAAQMMRRILVDHARGHHARKRDGAKISFDDVISIPEQPEAGLLELDDALKTLTTIDQQKARIVELRFFGGLTVSEISEMMEMSPRTVMRHWRMAKAWLYGELKRNAPAI